MKAFWVGVSTMNVLEELSCRCALGIVTSSPTRGAQPHFGSANGDTYLLPIANCYAESWIGSLKRECLNHLFCFSLGHLDHITNAYVT